MKLIKRRLFKHVKSALPQLPDELVLMMIPKLSVNITYLHPYVIFSGSSEEWCEIRYPVGCNYTLPMNKTWNDDYSFSYCNYIVFWKNESVYHSEEIDECIEYIKRAKRYPESELEIETLIGTEQCYWLYCKDSVSRYNVPNW